MSKVLLKELRGPSVHRETGLLDLEYPIQVGQREKAQLRFRASKSHALIVD